MAETHRQHDKSLSGYHESITVQSTLSTQLWVLLQELPDLSSHIVICVEKLDLADSVLQDPQVQRVLCMYNFLPTFCQSAQQCTATMPKLQSPMTLHHATVRSLAPGTASITQLSFSQCTQPAELSQSESILQHSRRWYHKPGFQSPEPTLPIYTLHATHMLQKGYALTQITIK